MANVDYIGKCLLVETGDKVNLIVGDLHLGFEEALENSGSLVGRRMFREIVSELDEVFDEIEKRKKIVERVVFLGDVKHEFFALSKQESGDLTKLIDYLEIKLGMVDRKASFLKLLQ